MQNSASKKKEDRKTHTLETGSTTLAHLQRERRETRGNGADSSPTRGSKSPRNMSTTGQLLGVYLGQQMLHQLLQITVLVYLNHLYFLLQPSTTF